MKKNLILLIPFVAFMSMQTMLSQTWVMNGNNVSTDARLGTNTGFDLIIETANSERFRVTDGGMIGIGTSTPSSTLHVSGAFRMDGNITLGNYVDATAEPMRFTYLDQNGILMGGSVEDLFHALNEHSGCIYYTGQPLPLPAWHSSSTMDYGIISTGVGCPARVGIGKEFPITELYVQGTSFSSSLIVGNDNLVSPNDADFKFRIGKVGPTPQTIFEVKKDGDTRVNYFGGEQGMPFSIYNDFGLTQNPIFEVKDKGDIRVTYFGGELGVPLSIYNVIGTTQYPIFKVKDKGDTRITYFGGENGTPFAVGNGTNPHDFLNIHPTGTIDFKYFGEPDQIFLNFSNQNVPEGEDSGVAILMANGIWMCQGVIVKHVPFWGDFVFDKDYDLKPLSEVEAFIKDHHHLPEIPTAQEVKENGIALEEMIRLLTIKVEELTLHAIAQEKEIEALKGQVTVPSKIEIEKK